MTTVDFSKVGEATGVDLADLAAYRELRVSQLAETAAEASGLRDLLGDVARRVVAEVAALPAVQGIAGQVSAAAPVVAAWGSFLTAATSTAKAAEVANLRRRYAAMDKFWTEVYRPGVWRANTRVYGPPKPDIVLRKPYNGSVSAFTGQFSPPGVVYSAARTGRDALRETFPGDDGAPLSGAWVLGGEWTIYGPVGPLPTIASGPSCEGADLDYRPCEDSTAGKWARIQRWGCIPYSYTAPCVPPSACYLPSCLGAGPHWGHLGQVFPLSPAGLAVYLGVQSPSPSHLAVRREVVAQSLRDLVTACDVLRLPRDPGQAAAPGVYRRGVLPVVRGSAAIGWTPGPQVAYSTRKNFVVWENLAAVIQAHLDFLALRESILATLAGLPAELQDAAAASPDPELRAVAGGEAYSADGYSADDPLGLAPRGGQAATGVRPGGRPGGSAGSSGREGREASGGGGGGLGLVIGGAALVGGAMLLRRRRR